MCLPFDFMKEIYVIDNAESESANRFYVSYTVFVKRHYLPYRLSEAESRMRQCRKILGYANWKYEICLPFDLMKEMYAIEYAESEYESHFHESSLVFVKRHCLQPICHIGCTIRNVVCGAINKY